MGSYYISVSHVPKFEEIPTALSIWPLREEYQKMEIIVLIGTNCHRQFLLLNVLQKFKKNSMHLQKNVVVCSDFQKCLYLGHPRVKLQFRKYIINHEFCSSYQKVYVFGPARHVTSSRVIFRHCINVVPWPWIENKCQVSSFIDRLENPVQRPLFLCKVNNK